MIQLLIEKHPEAQFETDCEGMTPRLLACIKEAPKEVVELLFQSQFTPLHGAFISKAPEQVAKFLFQMFPECVQQKDKDGWTALHFACFERASFHIIQWLVF